jgi:hypothetical protein
MRIASVSASCDDGLCSLLSQYYAIDLGGSNLRVVAVTLDGAGGVTTQEWKETIPVEVCCCCRCGCSIRLRQVVD